MISKIVLERKFCKLNSYLQDETKIRDYRDKSPPYLWTLGPSQNDDVFSEEDELSWDDIQTLGAAFVVSILAVAAHKGNSSSRT